MLIEATASETDQEASVSEKCSRVVLTSGGSKKPKRGDMFFIHMEERFLAALVQELRDGQYLHWIVQFHKAHQKRERARLREEKKLQVEMKPAAKKKKAAK